MGNFKIKVEEDTYWKEVRREDIEGNVFCPECETVLMINLTSFFILAYCPNCRKYFELMKKM